MQVDAMIFMEQIVFSMLHETDSLTKPLMFHEAVLVQAY